MEQKNQKIFDRTSPPKRALDRRPNILYIFTDQQSENMMSCAGNPWLKTPAMDRVAAFGTRFPNAYCANPVCVPSRMSMMTGRMPSEMNMINNTGKQAVVSPEMTANALGHLVARAGYDSAYAGKRHLPACLDLDKIGFPNLLTKNEREECAQKSAEFIKQKRDKPFFLVCSLINPHDICLMGIRDHAVRDFDHLILSKGKTELACLDKALERPAGVDDATFWRDHCPPLPPNYEPADDEPEAVHEFLKERPFQAYIRAHWSDETWRMHRWAYARLTERVDAEIGVVLDALRDSGQEEDTVVIFSSDHGDNDASRRMEHKSVPYDEASRVPFILAWKGKTKAGSVCDRLVLNGLDLIPTICDYAGIATPPSMRGRSVRPLAEGREVKDWRDHVVIESEIARAIRDDRYKYIVFAKGARRFQLFDLQEDPYETRNLIKQPEMEAVRDRLHRRLVADIREIGDPFGSQYVPESLEGVELT
jgi:choline-sulfatase